MQRPIPWVWLLLLGLLLLAPGPAGRVFLDLLGGLTALVLVLPLVLGGVGWIGWQVLRRRLRTCAACGFTTLDRSPQCPACGASFEHAAGASAGEPFNTFGGVPLGRADVGTGRDAPASQATIDVEVVDVESES
jgi:hypothetical protein